MLTDYFHVQLGSVVQLAIPITHATVTIAENRRNVCPLPGVSPHLMGVINQRGRLLWVMDLQSLLGIKVSENRRISNTDKMTLLAVSPDAERCDAGDLTRPQLGLAISSLKGLISLDRDRLKPLPRNLPPSIRTYLAGITTLNDARIAILNVPAIFQSLQAPSFATQQPSNTAPISLTANSEVACCNNCVRPVL